MLQFTIKNQKNSGRVCLHITDQGTAIAVSKIVGTSLILQHCAYFNSFDLSDNPELIADFIQQNNLASANCSLILCSSEYQLLLTETPDVKADEMCQALWWKVKDLVAFELENAQIDFIDLPEGSNRQQIRRVYAVIADKAKVRAKIALAEALGLNPVTVEIPETALLHLIADLCSDLVGTSILYLDPEQSLLLLMSEGQMYLSRTLQYNYLDRMEAVVLDLQRSMDYYESQLGKSPCLKVLVLPQQADDSAIMQTLRSNMGAEITSVDLNALITADTELNIELQQHCFIAVCGALRSNQKAKK